MTIVIQTSRIWLLYTWHRFYKTMTSNLWFWHHCFYLSLLFRFHWLQNKWWKPKVAGHGSEEWTFRYHNIKKHVGRVFVSLIWTTWVQKQTLTHCLVYEGSIYEDNLAQFLGEHLEYKDDGMIVMDQCGLIDRIIMHLGLEEATPKATHTEKMALQKHPLWLFQRKFQLPIYCWHAILSCKQLSRPQIAFNL